jgi:hypothetical protein
MENSGDREFTLTIKVEVRDWVSKGGRAALLEHLALKAKEWEDIQGIPVSPTSGYEVGLAVRSFKAEETAYLTPEGTRVEGRRQEERCKGICCR